MKKLLCLCLAAMTLLSLCACGAQTAPAAPDPTAAPAAEPTASPVTPPPGMNASLPGAGAAAETSAPEASDTLRIAQGLIDESVDKLLEALGEPDFVDHAPSCIGPGEDGEYHYGSVVVYTYRDDSGEIIKDVEG